jgi:hypothetical protein
MGTIDSVAERISSRILLVGAVMSIALGTGCGSDTDTGADATDPTAIDVTDTAAAGTTATSAVDAASAGGAATTGSEICERLTADAVAADLDLEVTAAVPDDSTTPQCAYEYASDTGATSNLTVAFMRPEDVAGRTGSDAYEFTLDINRAFAGDDEEVVDAGDEAVRLGGSGIHVGVVRVGDEVYTLLVPADDAEPAAIERLIATMATTLG